MRGKIIMSIEDLLDSFTENPYNKFLIWVLTVSGSIFNILKELNKRPSARENWLDNQNAELYFSKALVTEEIAIWKGFHSSHPLLTRYASVISHKAATNREKDLSSLSQIISDALRDEECQKRKVFYIAVQELISSSYDPLLERAKMQFEHSGDAENVKNVEKLISRKFEDPVTWIRAEEKVLTGLQQWTPNCKTPNRMKKIENYLNVRRNALDKCIKFGTRLLLAKKFYDAASIYPETDNFPAYRLDLCNAVGRGLTKEEGDLVVTFSNDVIMEVLGIILGHSS